MEGLIVIWILIAIWGLFTAFGVGKIESESRVEKDEKYSFKMMNEKINQKSDEQLKRT